MMEYVDVRGPYPVYICGLKAVELTGIDRRVTVYVARNLADAIIRLGRVEPSN